MEDPSEFEGSVQRTSEILDAGILEDIFTKKRFVKLELGKEAAEIHVQVFQVKDAISIWREIQLENLKDSQEQQVAHIADLKEEYLDRKKRLAATVRSFRQKYIEHSGDPDLRSIVSDAKELVDSFKENFDFVTTANKFTESSFLDTYRAIQTLPNPETVFDGCLRACLKAHESLKAAQEQLDIANELVESHSSLQKSAAYNHQPNSHEQVVRLTDELNHSRDAVIRMQREMSEMRMRFDLELRNRELNARSSFEARSLEQQQQNEEAMAEKDKEMSALLSSLNEATQRLLEAEERGKTLEVESFKRKELEDKMRGYLTELTATKLQLQDLVAQNKRLSVAHQSSETALLLAEKKSGDVAVTLKAELELSKARLRQLEAEMLTRPPADLTQLASRIGVVMDESFGQDALKKEREVVALTWPAVESLIVETVRKVNLEATKGRIALDEATNRFSIVEEECASLRTKLQDKVEAVSVLERDLIVTQSALESTKALVKTLKSHASLLTGAVSVSLPAYGSSNANTPSKSAAPEHMGQGGRYTRSTPQKDNQLISDVADLEKGSGGYGIEALVLGCADDGYEIESVTLTGNPGDRVMLAMQSQRDRLMKISQEKEHELVVLRSRLGRAQDEQNQLKSENMELYRRLRMLRLSSSTSAAPASSSSSSSRGHGSGSSFRRNNEGYDDSGIKTRGRKQLSADATEGDGLDTKYMNLYEEKMDPFRLEEFDRHSMFSHLNIFERVLASASRFLLQDKWTRHALVVYLFLVHCFALGYVIQVLNPTLIDEVDSHLKRKWSTATMDFNMMREHPDV